MGFGIGGEAAVVTGAVSAWGYATAQQLLLEGARVVIADQFPDRLETAAASVLSYGGEVHPVVVDVTRTPSVDALPDAALAKPGAIDFLVNAVGATGFTGDFHEIGDEGWLDTIQILLMGTVRVARAFIPGMVERGQGRVILFGSDDAEQPYPDELPIAPPRPASSTSPRACRRPIPSTARS